MEKIIASRTPEGVPNHCPLCDAQICIEPSQPAGDAPYPECGILLWFIKTSAGTRYYEWEAVAPIRDRLIELIRENLGVSEAQVIDATSFADIGGDSLDIVELVMELEEEFDFTPSDDREEIKTVGDAIEYIIRYRSGGNQGKEEGQR